MTGLKDLAHASREEFTRFVNSFDYVFCDIDGTLVLTGAVIPGAQECVSKFRSQGKRVAYFTNNGFTKIERIRSKLKAFSPGDDDVITPTKSIVLYLKRIKFDRAIYVIGTPNLVESLREAGFEIASFEPDQIGDADDELWEMRKQCLATRKTEVGAVIADVDFKFTLVKAQRAVALLNAAPDVLFLCGATDDSTSLGDGIKMVGPKYYVEAIEHLTGRKHTALAKPSVNMKEVLQENFKITDPRRVLFIGDSISSDMGFAANCGFQKLLVLSGTAHRSDVEDWRHLAEHVPDYYVTDIGVFNELLNKYE
ncbi:glycerol-3-phosphate phosphatase-like [Cylas formicarius]|uniref:glycerol-3-phosphate phosphatase-like n=1 Tax=Cylas formicarius TaxID=197179 RepID=UPI0029587042|nr:glycerol-3-phosphate phosphatase-like [Cylas formicarius]